MSRWRGLSMGLVLCAAAWGHAPVTPPLQGPLRISGASLVDGGGLKVALKGVVVPGLERWGEPAAAAQQAAMTEASFGVLRVRWNLNTVRLPVSLDIWKRDGDRYLAAVEEIVDRAERWELAVVLAARETSMRGMPGADAEAFWRAFGAKFKGRGRIVFSLYHQPSAANVPGAAVAERTAADWEFWRRGGVLRTGEQAVGMERLVAAVRAAGAENVVAAPAFHDNLGFQGYDGVFSGGNVMLETQPSFALWKTEADRQRGFGFLGSKAALYAGEWGVDFSRTPSGCGALPTDWRSMEEMVFRAFVDFDTQGMSYTVGEFRHGSLLENLEEYTPSQFGQSWQCGEDAMGMGQMLLTWTTGDAEGFGALRPGQIASAAGGPAGPIAPGQLVAIYVEQMGPAMGASAAFGADGKLPDYLGGTSVYFDGVSAPLLYAGAFQINVQAPFALRGKRTVTVQALWRGVPSGRAVVEVADAAPELFGDPFTRVLVAANEDGRRNGSSAPAASGSVVVIYGTGGGESLGSNETGAAASGGIRELGLRMPVAVTVDGAPAEVLFAGYAPGLVGVVQLNLRLPGQLGTFRRMAQVVWKVGEATNRGGGVLWVGQ